MTIAVSHRPAEPPAGTSTRRPSSGAAWAMLACGVACGLTVGQFGAARSARAELYALKRDVAELRRSADALTTAGGRAGETTSLLEELRAQRAAVRDAAGAWKEADAALARAAVLRGRADAALADATATAEVGAGVAAKVSDHLGATRAAEAAAAETGAVLQSVAATGEEVGAARAAAETAAAARRELIAGQAALIDGQNAAFAAQREALAAADRSAARSAAAAGRLTAGAKLVAAEAADATANLNDAAVALADLSALKQLVAAAGADFAPVWRSLDGLLTLRDTLLAEGPAVDRVASGPTAVTP